MKEKLYIHNDAPEELKQVVDVSQQMLDTMKEFKAKADNGTLTLDDLRELTRRNNALSKEYPRKAEPNADAPPRTNDMDELKRYAKARMEESTRQVEADGGPVFKVNGLDKLKELSFMPPMALGKMVLNEAEKKNKPTKFIEEGRESDEEFESPKTPIQHQFNYQLIEERFETFCFYYHHAKRVYFDLPWEWTKAEPHEANLYKSGSTFNGYGERGTDWLKAVLAGEAEDEDLSEKRTEAALALVSRNNKETGDIDDLLERWQDDENLRDPIVRALKTSDNDQVDQCLNELFDNTSPEIKAGIIEILEYRKRIDTDRWMVFLQNEDPEVCEKIVRAFLNNGIEVETESFRPLLNDPEKDFFEEALFSAFMNGEAAFFLQARVLNDSKPETVDRLPLYLACAGNRNDYPVLLKSLDQEDCFKAAVRGLGIMGLTPGVPVLIDRFSWSIASKDDWDMQTVIHDSLNLITGAGLELPFPDIVPGSESKECEVEIRVRFKDIWSRWWLDHRQMFREHTRYRRGVCWTLGSCIDEMAYEKGNYWSRQYSYYELVIRSGEHIAPFFADWDVNDQLDAIDKWREWWLEKGHRFPENPWLFHGEQPGRLF